MRPVELQPAIFQTPNVEKSGQQEVANPRIAQQAFAAELQRNASERPSQVQAPEAKQEAQPAEVRPEERGESRQRRRSRREAERRGAVQAGDDRAPADGGGTPDRPPAPGSRVDVVI